MPDVNNNNNLPLRGCIIWMHGLGADASDMAGLAGQAPIARLALNHVFLDAPVRPVTLNAGMRMRAWYDIVGMELTDREDKIGISLSQAQILEVIDAQIKAGFRAEEILLAGFSQGGAMALYTAIHCNLPLGGVISLSSYLPMARDCKPVLQKNTPIFMGFGQYDQLVLPEFTQVTNQWLLAAGYNQITLRQYPMEHSICGEEIIDVANWLSIQLRGDAAV